MNICKNCKSKVQDNYCSNCGHPQKLARINGRYILSEIGSVLNFQKGIFYTIKELIIRPGQNIKAFISEDRNRLVKPILFILICSLAYSIIIRLFHLEDGYVKFSSEEQTAITSIFEWIQNNYGYANIIMGVFISIWIKILFRKYDYNIFEILILLCFIMGIGMLMFSAFGIFEGLTKYKTMNIAGLLFLAYCTWAIGQFFEKAKMINYVKALVAYSLGLISFTFLAIGLGLLIDLTK